MTPMKAIRAKCLECSCGSPNEVKLCPIKDCALYPFRLGKNPNIQPREYTEEQRAVMRERGKALRTKNSRFPDKEESQTAPGEGKDMSEDFPAEKGA